MQYSIETGVKPLIRETEGSAGLDICCKDDFQVNYGRNKIPTGVRIKIDNGEVCDVRPRSGCSAKGIEDNRGRRMNADVLLGTVDSDYRGEIFISLKSEEKESFTIRKGTAIAQLVVLKCDVSQPVLVDSIDVDTERGEKGFGG